MPHAGASVTGGTSGSNNSLLLTTLERPSYSRDGLTRVTFSDDFLTSSLRAMNPEISAAPADGAKAAEAPPPAISVLLVEDDRSVRRYLEVTLQRAGYQVITAGDGLAGMRCALTTKVDVVITDAVMPEMTGQQLARFLRSNSKLAKLPIILLTGHDNDKRLGADKTLIDAFLHKPINAEELKKCLAKLLNTPVSEARP